MWYLKTKEQALLELKTREQGITQYEATQRLEEYGPNELKKARKLTPLRIFLEQFRSFLIIILIAAVVISLLLGEFIDGMAILVIVMLNAILGFVQEYRAEKTLEALEKMASPTAKVMRNGSIVEVDRREIVPGDIIILEEGDRVVADSLLLQSSSLRIDEAMLTGESLPVDKDVGIIKKQVPISERKNMAFMGTIVTYGRAEALVVATGMNTEMGKIAKMVQEEKAGETPLQHKLQKLGKQLGILVIAIVALLFFVGFYFENYNIVDMFLTSISLAVSEVPEGLPAVVTVTLAIGMRRMVKRNAIVRKLSAVEALGAVTVICSDKTGTLTKDEMTVKRVYTNQRVYDVSGIGYEPEGHISLSGKKVDPATDRHLSMVLKGSRLCNNAVLEKKKRHWSVIGDPTEGALVVLAEKVGFTKKRLEKETPKISEIPFSSERKMMTTIHKNGRGIVTYTKGAPEIVLELCDKILENGKVRRMTKKDREIVSGKIKDMACDALRVLGLGYREMKKTPKVIKFDEIEEDMVFIGLVGMIDPPRIGVKHAIKMCDQAGIRVVMVTGDHQLTAVAVADELNILREGKVITGDELQNMSDEQLNTVIENVNVYARVLPEHKVRILGALKSKGHIVAMTGDGANDAPALKKADIGVAMGIKGTDVSKEASDMILTDDNFATIVNSIEEGRGIYDNIRKFIRFLFSANFDETALITIITLLALPLPLIPIQILWLNLATDGLPALALGIDPKEKDIMKRPPRNPKKGILSGMMFFILAITVVNLISGLSVYFWGYSILGESIDKIRTMVFTTLVMFELFVVFNCKSEKHWVFNRETFNNKWLIIAVVISFGLHLFILYNPLMQVVFKTVPLSLFDWGRVLLLSSWGLLIHPKFFYKEKAFIDGHKKTVLDD